MSRCDYCGTVLIDEPAAIRGREMVDERQHTPEQCREYIFAALGSYKRDAGKATALIRELADMLERCDAFGRNNPRLDEVRDMLARPDVRAARGQK